MILHPPFEISSRLLPGVRIGGAMIQLERTGEIGSFNKPKWCWHIDLADGQEFTDNDLGGHGTTQQMFGSLLAFLSAFAEAHAYQDRTGAESDNADLFPKGLKDWAVENINDIDLLRFEIEEQNTAYIEE